MVFEDCCPVITCLITATTAVTTSPYEPPSPRIICSIANMAQQLDPDQYTYPFQLTKTIHRDPYDELLPSKPSNSQEGKIVIVTGAYGGIGSVFLYTIFEIFL
jgi:FlaA1/EpsC-like NDP-sugar epimerase